MKLGLYKSKMEHCTFVAVILCCMHMHTQSFEVVEELYAFYTSISGVGEILAELQDVSLASCGQECSQTRICTAANYSPSNMTCTLLHVDDALDNWLHADDVTFICAQCRQSPRGEFYYNEGYFASDGQSLLHITFIVSLSK